MHLEKIPLTHVQVPEAATKQIRDTVASVRLDSIISAGYGFICGAYMPISSFSDGLQKVIAFLPGTYGTSLIRNHAMQGVLAEMEKSGIPAQVVDSLKHALDCNLYFFGEQVSIPAMYAIPGGTVAVLVTVYILVDALKKR